MPNTPVFAWSILTVSTGGTVKVRLRRADGTVFFGETRSGAPGRLVASFVRTVVPWHGLSGISCGASWGNTCQLQLLHSQSVHVKVFEADLELKSNSAIHEKPVWKVLHTMGNPTLESLHHDRMVRFVD